MKTESWKFFIAGKQFCRIYDFSKIKDSGKNMFIGSLLCCGSPSMNISAVGTDAGYCVCVGLTEDVIKEDIDTVLGSIDLYYDEALEAK